jgi:hypothetical protein
MLDNIKQSPTYLMMSTIDVSMEVRPTLTLETVAP